MKSRYFLVLLFSLFPIFCVFGLTEQEKQNAVLEFKKKLFSEEELRKDKGKKSGGKTEVLDDEDFEVLLEDEPEDEKEKKENNNEKRKKKEDRVKNSEEKSTKKVPDSKKVKEESKSKIKTEKKSEKNVIDTKVIETNVRSNLEDKLTKEKETKLFNKLYNITDTGVSEEFLYSDEYKRLLNNTTTLQKTDLNKEDDIPILYASEKDIIDYNTTEIPNEILDYKRTEENSHIPNIISDYDMRNIAKKAVLENNFAVFRGVIEQIGDPDYMVDNTRSAFVFCIENDSYPLVKYLIYNGVSINRIDDEGNTPLHVAVSRKNIDLIKLLIESGADFDIQNNEGNTPLMLALDEGFDNIVLFLMKIGASVELKNKNGETPYSLAIKYKKRRIQQHIMDVLRNGRFEDEL